LIEWRAGEQLARCLICTAGPLRAVLLSRRRNGREELRSLRPATINGGQKKAPAGEDRRALLTGEGRKSGQSPSFQSNFDRWLLSLTVPQLCAFNCELSTVTELPAKLRPFRGDGCAKLLTSGDPRILSTCPRRQKMKKIKR
jgi:hypothetical protein